MKAIDRQIRLQQWRLDEQRRKVAELERLAERLRAEIAQLDRDIAADKHATTVGPGKDAAGGDGPSATRARRDRLMQSLTGLQGEMSHAVGEADAAYREFKNLDLIRIREEKRLELRRKRARKTAEEEGGDAHYRRASGT